MEVSIIPRQLTFAEQLAAGFFSDQGWGAEPITKKQGDVLGKLFPSQEDELCVTAFKGQTPIGHCKANNWLKFSHEININVNVLLNTNTDPDTNTFLTLVRSVIDFQFYALRVFLYGAGFRWNTIAHNCGLMVVSTHGNLGIATRLVAESDKLLASKGYKAVVVETTNIKSKKAFLKNGYVEYKEYYLPEYGIDIDDNYSILYKIL